MAYTGINKSTDYFNTKLYSGNGASTHAITGVGHQPDFVWIKKRSGTGSHNLVDAVRGVQKALESNSTGAQGTYSNNLSAFGTDGFTVGSGSLVNDNGETFVSWNWKANGAGSANTDGSINTTATSANTTAGISIVTHTGNGSTATIGHGLGAVPKVIISRKTTTDNWFTYHHSLGNGKYILLEATDAEATSSNVWNDTTPTSSVFTKGGPANENAATYISYCFAEKSGFSKFGKYIGNGSTDGSFIYTGFKPAWIMQKRTDSANNWNIYDVKRSTNVVNKYLYADDNSAEITSTAIDILSNGFKCKSSSTFLNGSGAGYIYMAFAEAPLVGSNNIPATAR